MQGEINIRYVRLLIFFSYWRFFNCIIFVYTALPLIAYFLHTLKICKRLVYSRRVHFSSDLGFSSDTD